ncbi:MAG: hypothetical protein ACK5B9_12625 [Flavobacteriia bacterium]|jgi:hypothetical protein
MSSTFSVLILSIGMSFSLLVNGQNTNSQLEISVLKETLPQLLNNNPNSAASYLKNGGGYKLMVEILNSKFIRDTIGARQTLLELNKLSDSLSEVLSKQKIFVLLSDTLFVYKYSPNIWKNIGGESDTTDLKNLEDWDYEKDILIETFQTDYENRGFKKPIDLEFIDLIKEQINLNSSHIIIDLKELNNSYYEYRPLIDSNLVGTLRFNGVRLYRPVFNDKMDKACYLFSFQSSNGPFREFVFVEKQENKWIFIDSYGSHHIDSDDNWYKQ